MCAQRLPDSRCLALVQQRVTDLWDVQSVVRSALPSFLEKVDRSSSAAAGS